MEQPKERMMAMRLRGMMAALVIEFITGVTLGTFWAYDPTVTTQSRAVSIILGIHILLAIGLIIGSITALFGAIKTKAAKLKTILLGFICILGAAVSGSVVVNTSHQNLGIFLMAMFFLAALLIYGRWLGEVMNTLKKN